LVCELTIEGDQYEYVFNSKGMYRGMIDPNGSETAIFEQD
jgi:beta-aspartyl-peptidase (threonine type)